MEPPKLSKVLRGYKICLTGFVSKMELLKMINIVNRLGGVYAEKVAVDATCMIVNRVGGKDFKLGCQLKLTLVDVQWLHDCLQQNAALKMKNYPVKVFAGLIITCTQLIPEERANLQQIVEENGGTYSSRLVKDTVTHLIAKEAAGEKFCYAKLWNNVHVVDMKWVEECVRMKGS